ncbi:MAG: GNAT family N-acetyltransferase [Candidatus Bathyarchaeota archaeon]|nr:MAG: GNAT family N-acetyltransferase [Candidatus Bathyarchaeota archaeon]
MSIRSGRTSDYNLGLPLLEKLYHGDIGLDLKQAFIDYVRKENGVVLFAEDAGKVVGILVGSFQLDIDWEGKTGKIDAIIVDEKQRRRGVGRKLVQRFLAWAKRKGCKAVKARINRENDVAQEFHRSLGFEEAETYEYFLDFDHPRES